MAGRLKDKIAIVTGAASGLGEATARLFVSEGATVILADIQVELGQALAKELGATFVRTDVTREDDIAALVKTAKTNFGRLDCMINNAGLMGSVGSIAQMPLEHWNATIAVLQTSVFLGIKHAARIMIEQKDGCILSTSSTAGIAAMGPHAYTTAKHAVVGLTRTAASELAGHGIRVNAVAPGTVATNLTGNAMGGIEAARAVSAQRSPLGRAIEPKDVAAGFLYFASDDGRNVTGQVLVIDGGVTTRVAHTNYAARDATFIDVHPAS
jgi:NAD(P)-dependent dehydrogenase (short-subunit alcohol dehydrogenase family)